MGLLKHLLLWPVTLPLAIAESSVRRVEGVARRELTDDARVKEELMALHMELELGDIDLDEYERREAELMARLKEAREWRQHFGMEDAWTPLSFSTPDGDGDDVARDPGPQESGGSGPWPPSSSPTSSPDSSSS